MNDSSFRFLSQTLKTNRTRLLRTKARMFCPECQIVQAVVDFFQSKEALLECGHRRKTASDSVITEFEREKKKRGNVRATGFQAGSVMSVEDIAQEVEGKC